MVVRAASIPRVAATWRAGTARRGNERDAERIQYWPKTTNQSARATMPRAREGRPPVLAQAFPVIQCFIIGFHPGAIVPEPPSLLYSQKIGLDNREKSHGVVGRWQDRASNRSSLLQQSKASASSIAHPRPRDQPAMRGRPWKKKCKRSDLLACTMCVHSAFVKYSPLNEDQPRELSQSIAPHPDWRRLRASWISQKRRPPRNTLSLRLHRAHDRGLATFCDKPHCLRRISTGNCACVLTEKLGSWVSECDQGHGKSLPVRPK